MSTWVFLKKNELGKKKLAQRIVNWQRLQILFVCDIKFLKFWSSKILWKVQANYLFSKQNVGNHRRFQRGKCYRRRYISIVSCKMLLFWYLFIHSVHCYCKNILGDVSRPSDYLHLQTAAVSTEWGQLCSVLHRLLQRQDTVQYSSFLVFECTVDGQTDTISHLL